MDLYFLNEDFEPITGAVDVFSSIVWSERYFENGTFTLHFPRELLPDVYDAVYVRTGVENGKLKCGRIGYIKADDEEDIGGCEMGGSLLEALLDDRIIAGKGSIVGGLTDVVCAVVSDNLRDCGVVIENDLEIAAEVLLTYDRDVLSEWLYSVLRPYGASYRIELDPDRNVPIFKIVRGVDRSSGLGESESGAYGDGQVIFSTSFGNMASLCFERDVSVSKNAIYVEGSDGTVVFADTGGGGTRREMYRHVTDVKPDDFEDTSAYEAALYSRGREILAGYAETYRIDAAAKADVFPKYGIDYALGDVCDVADGSLGLAFGMRLTAVDDVCENGMRILYPTFGEELHKIRRLSVGRAER